MHVLQILWPFRVIKRGGDEDERIKAPINAVETIVQQATTQGRAKFTLEDEQKKEAGRGKYKTIKQSHFALPYNWLDVADLRCPQIRSHYDKSWQKVKVPITCLKGQNKTKIFPQMTLNFIPSTVTLARRHKTIYLGTAYACPPTHPHPQKTFKLTIRRVAAWPSIHISETRVFYKM